MTEAQILIRASHTLENARDRILRQKWRDRETREQATIHLEDARRSLERAIEYLSEDVS